MLFVLKKTIKEGVQERNDWQRHRKRTYQISSVSLVNLIANPRIDSGHICFYTEELGSFTTGTPAYAGSKRREGYHNYRKFPIAGLQTGKIIEPQTYKLTFTAYSKTGRDVAVQAVKESPYTNYGLSYTVSLGTTWQTLQRRFTFSGIHKHSKWRTV